MTEKINMPWEERPAGCTDVMWRYSQNPVIGRYHILLPTVFSTVLSFLSKMVLPVYSVVIIKRYR